MLDTVVLTLDCQQFEILQPDRFSPSAKGVLSPPYYPLGSRGNIACVQNPTKADLQAGRYLPRLTLTKRKISNGFAQTLRIEFSAPKLIFGNNFDELETGDFAKVLIALLRQHANEFGLTKEDGNPNEQGIEEVAKIANWDSKGGAPKTPF